MILEKCRQVTGADAGSVYVSRTRSASGAPVARSACTSCCRRTTRSRSTSRSSRSPSTTSRSSARRCSTRAADQHPRPRARARRPGKTPGLPPQPQLRRQDRLPRPLDADRADALGADEVIGVVQLINKKRDPAQPLAPATSTARWSRSTSAPRSWRSALARRPGISLENALLYEEIRGCSRASSTRR